MNHIFMYIDNRLALRQIVAVLRTELLEMCCLHSVQDQNPFIRERPTLKVQRKIFMKTRGNFHFDLFVFSLRPGLNITPSLPCRQSEASALAHF